MIVLMGVSGAGKTTVGQLLASALGWRFIEADDYHSPDIRTRLARGERLSDADRAPWLERLAGVIRSEAAAEEPSDALVVDATLTPAELVGLIRDVLVPGPAI